LRFQLERALLSDPAMIPLKIKRRPKSGQPKHSHKTLEVKISARKMVLGFLQTVLPPLLKIEWHRESFTLEELFSSEIWDSFTEVKRKIIKGERLTFFESHVQNALERARGSIVRAEQVCGATELELGRRMTVHDTEPDYYDFETIQKRSRWPYAEFRCKFELSGKLVPTDYEVINKDLSKNDGVPPTSRRGMREVGWPVRDRFILISALKFHNVFRSDLVKWLEAGPRLCGREYVYLFDKGTGKPNLWLYSPPDHKPWLDLSRSSLLKSLGDFEKVKPEKLGDRISLA
jgi:hypothetical protein